MAIVATLIVEAAIPLLLTFRRTRYAGVLLGVPFHVGLGLVGHRTFSGLAFALYALFLMPDLLRLVSAGGKAIADRFGEQWPGRLQKIGSIGFALMACALIAADFTGNYRGGIGPLKVYRVAWAVWLLWSFVMGLAFAWCAWQAYVKRNSASDLERFSSPGWLWVVLPLVFLNGMSQYLGLKTETCFTMYSNLRTEGDYNNHMFMPAWRLADYQNDLVEIVETTHPELAEFVGSEQLLTYFELRRIVSRSDDDFELTFLRNGRREELHRRGDDHSDSELFTRHPLWQAKLLYFRPVPTGQCAACQH